MDSIKDCELIEKAGFIPEIKMAAWSAVASLHFLKGLSAKLGIPIEQITGEQLIKAFSEQNAQICKAREQLSDSLRGSSKRF